MTDPLIVDYNDLRTMGVKRTMKTLIRLERIGKWPVGFYETSNRRVWWYRDIVDYYAKLQANPHPSVQQRQEICRFAAECSVESRRASGLLPPEAVETGK